MASGTPEQQEARRLRKNEINSRRRKEVVAANRAMIISLKDSPCTDCGGRFPPCAMHFDHLDPSTKKFIIAKKLNTSKENILEEIAKCELVCANCHAIRTQKSRDANPDFGRRKPKLLVKVGGPPRYVYTS